MHGIFSKLASTLILYFVLLGCDKVNSNEFKKCGQETFCSRNLYFEDRPESYFVDNSTIIYQKNTLKFVLKNSYKEYIPNSRDLECKLYIMKNGIFRVRIREVASKEELEGKYYQRRFKIKNEDHTYNMKAMAKTKNVKFVQNSKEIIVYYYTTSKKNNYFIEIDNTKKTKYELKIQNSPFNLQYTMDNKIIFQMNSKNLLNMEFPPNDFKKSENDAMTAVKLDVHYPECLFLFGLPERAGDTLLMDTTEDAYRLYNIDNFKYSRDNTLGLYGSIPFILSHSYGGEVISGFIWNNPSETFVGVQSSEGGKDVLWVSEAGIIDISFFADLNIHNFYYKYHLYIGFAPLPPIFSLGYHQSRYTYKSTQDIANVDRLFDEFNIPYDSLWLDIDHTNDKKYMTWDDKFEGVEEFMDILDEKGRFLVTIIDPHIKADKGYFIYKDSLNNNYLINSSSDSSTKEFVGQCWSKDSVYIDFFDARARNYWTQLHLEESSYFFEARNLHIWNDMNEPSVFKQPEVTLPKLTTFKYNNTTYDHREGHNLYGYLMHRTTYEAMKMKYQRRPFVLTRSFYLGSHRYGATWTGDNRARFEDMEMSIPMIISNSISGYSFIGADVGGFAGDGESFLYSRWYLLGVFYPFFRAHSHTYSYRREPWLFDEDTYAIMKSSIITRYRLLPYIYSTFFQHSNSGYPIVRPLWFKYHNKFTLETYANKEFFLGDALLIRPVINMNENALNQLSVYLPEDERWFDFYSLSEYHPQGEVKMNITNNTIGVFIKGGCIIPMKWRTRRSSKLMKFDMITLIVALNSEESSSGMIYFDDEESLEYEEQGKFSLKKIMFQKNELFIANLSDQFQVTNKIERIIILGLKKKVTKVYYETAIGNASEVECTSHDYGKVELKRLQIPIDALWKIKFEYED